MVAGLVTGCAQKPTSTTAVSPVAKKTNLNLQLADVVPGVDAPAAPEATAVNSASAAESQAEAGPDIPFEGKNDAEKLTWALRAYFQDPNRPGITSLAPLVSDGIIRSVPVPPPGQKFVVDMRLCEVRLVKK